MVVEIGMHAGCCWVRQSQHPFVMYRISTAFRNVSARATAGGLLRSLPLKVVPSSAEHSSAGTLFRGGYDFSSFTNSRSRPTFLHPGGSQPLDVSAAGGPRPRKPLQWRTKNKKGSIARAEKLVGVIKGLSNSKEDVFGTLDAFIAWDLEFPLIAVKKALKILSEEQEWRRIIQVSKWMLEKGQGKTLGTYQLLLEAFDYEGRIEEAEVLWDRVLKDNMECIPKTMFAQIIKMYNRYEKPKQLLKVFADMEELQVIPDSVTIDVVAKAYAAHGYEEYGLSLFAKYPTTNPALRRRRGSNYRRPYVNPDSVTRDYASREEENLIANSDANEKANANVN